MNAKFEKWFKENSWKLSSHGEDQFSDADLVWTCAIQSLEVTPQLCQIAEAAYDAEPATPLCDSPAMKEALHAFLSTLKEQAK